MLSKEEHERVLREMESWHGHGADGMTYEEYKTKIYNECKKWTVAQVYSEDFEKVIKEYEESGKFRRNYERGVSPDSLVQPICLEI